MTSPKDDTPAAPPKPPTPKPPPRRRFVRYDFPPGVTPEEIVKGIRELAEKHLKPKP